MKTNSITKRFFFLLFLFFSLGFCFGQKNLKPGYIIDLKSDTVRGFVDYRNDILSGLKCVFYESVKAQPKTWLPGEISAYRIGDGRFYISKQIKSGTAEKTVFLEYLVNGITSLYFLKTDSTERYFIQKANELYELNNNVTIIKQGNDQYFKPSNQYKGMMRVIYADAKEIIPAINSSSFDKKSMMKLSEKYHDLVCTDRKCIVYEKNKKGVLFSIGPAVRYDYSVSKFENHLASFSWDAGQVISLGMAMNMRMDAINEKFNVGMVLMVGKEKNTGVKTYDYSTGKDITTLNIEKTGLQTNLILKYQYPKGKIRPSLGLGPDLTVMLKRNSKEILQSFNLAGNLFNEITTPTVINYKYEIGLAANAGIYIMLRKNMISLDLFYKLSKETYREIGTIAGMGNVSRDAILNAFGVSTAFFF